MGQQFHLQSSAGGIATETSDLSKSSSENLHPIRLTEPYLTKHYSNYLIRLTTADLMSMRRDIGLGGEMMCEGDEFTLTDEVTH